jgi:hypothetical protein
MPKSGAISKSREICGQIAATENHIPQQLHTTHSRCLQDHPGDVSSLLIFFISFWGGGGEVPFQEARCIDLVVVGFINCCYEINTLRVCMSLAMMESSGNYFGSMITEIWNSCLVAQCPLTNLQEKAKVSLLKSLPRASLVSPLTLDL